MQGRVAESMNNTKARRQATTTPLLAGEIVKLDPSGRPIFIDLMKRRGPFAFAAFDVLAVNGRDVRKMPLTERKKMLRAIVPRRSAVMLMADHVRRRGGISSPKSAVRISKVSSPSGADGVYDVAALPAWAEDQEPRVQPGGAIDKNCSRGRLRTQHATFPAAIAIKRR
jgi:ATP dependent DNA ligase-like protein